MKKLVSLYTLAFNLAVSGQTFPVKNVNIDFVSASIPGYDVDQRKLGEIERDNKGLYWFQGLTDIQSYDGVNWITYPVRSFVGKSSSLRINDLEILDDGSKLLATEDGIYLMQKGAPAFFPLKKIFPEINGIPLAVSCFSTVFPGIILFASQHNEGFYLLEWKTKQIRRIIIDSSSRVLIPGGKVLAVTSDGQSNIWGLATGNKGIWNYNRSTGKILCSWKGELPFLDHPRFQGLSSLEFSPGEKVLWLGYQENGYLEKMNPATGRSNFYSFSGSLMVTADSISKNQLPVYEIETDRENNVWVRVGSRFLVRLHKDIQSMEYFEVDSQMIPSGNLYSFMPDQGEIRKSTENNILLWILGREKVAMLKKRATLVRHIPFDTMQVQGVRPTDYDNPDGRQKIFFLDGKNGFYYLLQQNTGRPKIISLDRNLKVRNVLFNDKWKEYPAYFSSVFNADTFFIAIMRQGVEPLDFRNVVIKDFRVDIKRFKVEEIKLDFRQRIWRYGCPDANNVYWLFSHGSLFSYDPKTNSIDSIFICSPGEKGSYRLELIKGFDYPTVLHKKSNTFWIDFIPTKELYKINLVTKKVDRIFKCCMDNEDCDIPGGIYDMYNSDSDRILLQLSFSSMLLDPIHDSIFDLSDLFGHRLLPEMQNGFGRYKDWFFHINPLRINLLNVRSGKRLEYAYNEDFKWRISQFNSAPLINAEGEMILMSSINKGFLILDLDSLPAPSSPSVVLLSFIRLDNTSLQLDSLALRKNLTLKYSSFRNLQFGFTDYELFDPSKTAYEYALVTGKDTIWSRIEGKPELTFSELSPGKYSLLFRARNVVNEVSGISSFGIIITPLWWQTWWFKGLILAIAFMFLYGMYKIRMRQILKLQVVRNNIARDLHDDIGSTLNSISIYSEVARQQAGKDLPALDVIGAHSRKVIENMSDIVWTINPDNDTFEKIIIRMRSFAYQVLKAKNIEYTFEFDEKLNTIVLPMQVRKNFYLVFKEAITNLAKYSQATAVTISLKEKQKTIILSVRDNGNGIPANAEIQGNGLLNMKRRALEIKASLDIHSSNGHGTEIELKLDI